MKINLITPPDKIYNDAVSLLLVFPSKDIQKQVQDEILSTVETGLNVYIFDQKNYTKDSVDWLLNIFTLSNIVLVDVDQCPPYVKDLLSYMIAKPKTYWLTNAIETVYTHISSNRIYNLSVLRNLGGSVEEN